MALSLLKSALKSRTGKSSSSLDSNTTMTTAVNSDHMERSTTLNLTSSAGPNNDELNSSSSSSSAIPSNYEEEANGGPSKTGNTTFENSTRSTRRIDINGPFFIDSSGRRLILRGVNLSASKAPLHQPSHIDPVSHSSQLIFNLDLNSHKSDHKSNNIDHDDSSSSAQLAIDDDFDGTPLDLKDIDVHLARLRGWGFNCIRYVVPWEAIESKGPCVSSILAPPSYFLPQLL